MKDWWYERSARERMMRALHNVQMRYMPELPKRRGRPEEEDNNEC